MGWKLTAAVPAYVIEAVELVRDAGHGGCNDGAVESDKED